MRIGPFLWYICECFCCVHWWRDSNVNIGYHSLGRAPVLTIFSVMVIFIAGFQSQTATRFVMFETDFFFPK